jgi:hypothetical protein
MAVGVGVLLQMTAAAASLEIRIDAESARAVLAAVADSSLTRERALEVARLPGNGGLIEKARSYGIHADADLLADALLAAARHESSDADGFFGFAKVRDDSPAIQKTLSALTDPSAHTVEEVKRRITLLTPNRIEGEVVGYLVAGGASGGFAFGTPKFYLNLAKFPSSSFARTVLAHELYHGVQGLAGPAENRFRAACFKELPGGRHLAKLFGSLWEEGTASYAGDVLLFPQGADDIANAARNRLQTNIGLVHRSVTILELSVHALTTSSSIEYNDIYALGFYDDELLYALGYLISKAIATDLGPSALADLIDKPATDFLTTYTSLKSYGKERSTPKLGSETVEWAAKLAQCTAR